MAAADPAGRRPARQGPGRLATDPGEAGGSPAASGPDRDAIDGKTLRGARRPDGGQVHLLSALDTSTGIVLAQVTVAAKSNEISAFGPLPDAVEAVLGSLAGVVFVADALHTQTGHAQRI